MTILRLAASAMIGAVVLVGMTPAQEKDKVDIRGVVKKITATGLGDNIGSVLVEGKKQKDAHYDKAFVKITRKTKIFKMEGEEKKPATFKDFKEGQTVQATFIGPVAESYPVQATGGEIIILSAKK